MELVRLARDSFDWTIELKVCALTVSPPRESMTSSRGFTDLSADISDSVPTIKQNFKVLKRYSLLAKKCFEKKGNTSQNCIFEL